MEVLLGGVGAVVVEGGVRLPALLDLLSEAFSGVEAPQPIFSFFFEREK